MMKLIEGTHYMRRHEQPTPAPHKSKEVVDCLLCSDPGDDDIAPLGHVARKRSRPIGQNIRLDRFHVHLKAHHPDACRNGARSLFELGFTRRELGAAVTAPEGEALERMTSESLGSGHLDAGEDSHIVVLGLELDPHIGTSGGLGNDPSVPGHDSLIGVSGSLVTTPSLRIRQPSSTLVASSTLPTIAIAEINMASGSINFQAFAQHVDFVIKANSTAQVIPSAEAIAEEVLRQQQHHAHEKHGTGVFRELWKEHRIETNVVRDAGLAYRDTDDHGREIYCPTCLAYCGNKCYVGITSFPKLHVTKKTIGRHLGTARH